ncbi:hypothetical protein KP509_02G096400 [Ceratopteris richardii]|uniref:Cupin-like domain-containing protein n=1 Tax=Ceratopteris richardii TaxID=49495 RepID=A0A8T2VGU0_CERRI|nr:hypothetical protein KP509_02G096400 [Ceratopteris richardii]
MAETVKKCRLRVVAQVPLIDGLQTTYEEFRDQYMRPNSPVLISGLMDHWRAFDAWSSPCGAPNLDYLSSNFGNSHVQVFRCIPTLLERLNLTSICRTVTRLRAFSFR